MEVSRVCDIGAHWQCREILTCACACHKNRVRWEGFRLYQKVNWREVNIKLDCIDPTLNKNIAVRAWLDECAKKIHEELLKENENATDSRSQS